MTTRIITADEAKELLDSANDFTLVDPGYHCGGSFVECSLASDCGGDHPTGRLSALQIDAGEESETLCFAEEKDARLAAAAPDLAATVVAQAAEMERLTRERDDARAAQKESRVEMHRSRDALNALIRVVKRERKARAEWLASLPDGSCGNPPPAALIDAESATGEALRALTEVAR